MLFEEAGSGRWLGIRYPPLRAPLTAEQKRVAEQKRLKALRKAAAAQRKEEAAARRRAAGGWLVTSNGGLCGLYNMGNTCYLSVALQCLSQSRALTRYFRSSTFLRELNEDNPLGHKGQLALAYGTLIKQMWSIRAMDAIEPKKFRASAHRHRLAAKPDLAGTEAKA